MGGEDLPWQCDAMFKVVAQKKTEAKELCSKAEAALEAGIVNNAAELTEAKERLAGLADDAKAKVKDLTDGIKKMQELLKASGHAEAAEKKGLKSAMSTRSIRLTRDIESLDLPPQA